MLLDLYWAQFMAANIKFIQFHIIFKQFHPIFPQLSTAVSAKLHPRNTEKY